MVLLRSQIPDGVRMLGDFLQQAPRLQIFDDLLSRLERSKPA